MVYHAAFVFGGVLHNRIWLARVKIKWVELMNLICLSCRRSHNHCSCLFFFFFSKAIYITYFEICKTINFMHVYKCHWSLPNLKVAKVSQKNKRKLCFLRGAMTERLKLLLLLAIKLQFALHRLDWLSSGHLRKIHGEGLSIQVIYEDQEKNDFNSLFNRLSGKALSVQI